MKSARDVARPTVVMTLGFFRELFILLIATQLVMGTSVEDDIRSKIIKHLGMKHLPDMKHANVSSTEYQRMLSVYRQSVRQTEALRTLREHFDTHLQQTERFNNIVLYSDSKHKRRKRSSINASNRIERIHFNSSIFPRLTLVSSATLSVQLHLPGVGGECKVTAVQAVDGSDGITLDTVTSSDDKIVILDITHAVQAWVLDDSSNKGVVLVSEGCKVTSGDTAEIHLLVEQVKSRQKRSQERRRKKQPKKCRIRPMNVRFEDLAGFDFIYMPREFDASFCKGKCPPRYQPMNDHSLLQSLMYIKSSREAFKSGEKSKIKKPCCSPSQFESLDILHLDEADPTRLKVTNWKNIRVSQCACA